MPGDTYYEPAYHPAYGEPPVYIYPQPYIVRPYLAPPHRPTTAALATTATGMTAAPPPLATGGPGPGQRTRSPPRP